MHTSQLVYVRSSHNQIGSFFLLGTTTIDAHQSVGVCEVFTQPDRVFLLVGHNDYRCTLVSWCLVGHNDYRCTLVSWCLVGHNDYRCTLVSWCLVGHNDYRCTLVSWCLFGHNDYRCTSVSWCLFGHNDYRCTLVSWCLFGYNDYRCTPVSWCSHRTDLIQVLQAFELRFYFCLQWKWHPPWSRDGIWDSILFQFNFVAFLHSAKTWIELRIHLFVVDRCALDRLHTLNQMQCFNRWSSEQWLLQILHNVDILSCDSTLAVHLRTELAQHLQRVLARAKQFFRRLLQRCLLPRNAGVWDQCHISTHVHLEAPSLILRKNMDMPCLSSSRLGNCTQKCVFRWLFSHITDISVRPGFMFSRLSSPAVAHCGIMSLSRTLVAFCIFGGTQVLWFMWPSTFLAFLMLCSVVPVFCSLVHSIYHPWCKLMIAFACRCDDSCARHTSMHDASQLSVF